MVECLLAKENVASSNLVSRSIYYAAPRGGVFFAGNHPSTSLSVFQAANLLLYLDLVIIRKL